LNEFEIMLMDRNAEYTLMNKYLKYKLLNLF